MLESNLILADGITPGLIFVGVAALLWGLGAIFGKATPRDDAEGDALADIRRRMQREAERARTRATPHGRPPAMPQQPRPQHQSRNPSKQQKQRRRTTAADGGGQAVMQRPAVRAAPSVPVPHVSIPSHGDARLARASESARNVRLLLQPGSIREAFVLGEVLGKPKSMQ